MRYPIFIETGDESVAYGVIVPDLPGCFSAGDTLEEAMVNAEEAAAAWIDAALDAGEPVPEPSAPEHHLPDYEGMMLGVITVDPALLDDSIERINITLPRRVLARLDAKAREKTGGNRSNYIAQMAME